MKSGILAIFGILAIAAILAVLAMFGTPQGPRPPRIADEACGVREGDFIVQRRYRDCVDLLESERIRGFWLVGLEESGFVPEGEAPPPVRILSDDRLGSEAPTWLDAGWPEQQRLLARVPEPEGVGDASVYAVEFIGRRARDPGEYGHNGYYRHLIILDRLVSIRPAGKVRTRIEMLGLSCWIDDCDEEMARRDGRLRD